MHIKKLNVQTYRRIRAYAVLDFSDNNQTEIPLIRVQQDFSARNDDGRRRKFVEEATKKLRGRQIEGVCGSVARNGCRQTRVTCKGACPRSCFCQMVLFCNGQLFWSV